MRHKEFKKSLLEVNMGPRNLAMQVARSDAMVGIEFEMISPNIKDPDDYELMPNYDEDREAVTIEGVIDFFRYGDFGIGRNRADRLRAQLTADFEEFVDNKFEEDWQLTGVEYIFDYLKLEAAAGGKLISDDKLADYAEDIFKRPNHRIYRIVHEQESDNARDNWSHEDFFDGRLMSDIGNEYGLDWPYVESRTTVIEQLRDIGASFEHHIGQKVKVSGNYHGFIRRYQTEPNTWILEVDRTVVGTSEDDYGIELISPPMPVKDMIKAIKQVKHWAGIQGIFTNDTCGLHMNISTSNFSLEKLDYVKLVLFMGDEYVLREFERETNSYTKSAMEQIKQAVSWNPSTAYDAMEALQADFISTASALIHKKRTDKYVSANIHDDRIEFRGPGNNWLDMPTDKIVNTLYRFVYALEIACNSSLYQKEYIAKLYKFLSNYIRTAEEEDILMPFVYLQAGMIDKNTLKEKIRKNRYFRQRDAGTVFDRAKQRSNYIKNLRKERESSPSQPPIDIAANTTVTPTEHDPIDFRGIPHPPDWSGNIFNSDRE